MTSASRRRVSYRRRNVEHLPTILPAFLVGVGAAFAQAGERRGVLDARQFDEALRGVGPAIQGHADLDVVRQQPPAVELAQHVLQGARICRWRASFVEDRPLVVPA